MFALRSAGALLSLIAITNAAKHLGYVANEGGPNAIYTIEFDDETKTLALAKNNSVPVASGWLALSGDKKTLYSTNMGDISGSQDILASYSIGEDASLTFSSSLGASADSSGLGVWAGANPNPPYEVHTVYLTSQTVSSVHDNLTFDETFQGFTYGEESYSHGGYFHPSSKWLYTFDVDRNAIWTFAINQTTGAVSYLANTTVSSPVSGPRHGVVHPNGEKLYIVTENTNHVAQFSINTTTGIPSWDDVYFSLMQPGQNNSDFWSAEVNLSPSNNFLWGTNRGRTTANNGSVALHTLDESGSIIKQNFLINTTTSGGLSNLVQPVLFSDRYVAMPDLEVGFVQMWELAEDNSTATIIDQLDLADGGCCENIVWLN